jgi:hypothetical protein
MSTLLLNIAVSGSRKISYTRQFRASAWEVNKMFRRSFSCHAEVTDLPHVILRREED